MPPTNTNTDTNAGTSTGTGTGTDTIPDPAQALGLPELLRIMDVATALRQDRELVEQQLNRDELKARLRERLLAGSGVTGEKVTPEEVDAAIDRYFQNQNTFVEPPKGFEVALANLYVRRRSLALTLCAALAVVVGMWLMLGWVRGAGRTRRTVPSRTATAALSPEARRSRDLTESWNAATASLKAIHAGTTDPEALRQADQLGEQAGAFYKNENLDRLGQVRAELDALDHRLAEDYTVRIVTRPGQKSGIDRYFTDEEGKRASGLYLIVEAIGPDGAVRKRRIRNAETGRTQEVSVWAERVPKEVFDRIAADKRRDGIVDEDIFAVKRRGQLEEQVTLPGPDGRPLARLGQITQW